MPPENLLGGEEGQGFVQLMQQLPQERLALAVGAVASMERAIKLTTEYTKERKAFGKPLMDGTPDQVRTSEEVRAAYLGQEGAA